MGDFAELMIYMRTDSTDPQYNLAFEEYVLQNRRDGDYLLLWQNANSIIIGANQNAEAEINKEFVERNDVKVVRRTTGGGAVFHDLGNLNYSFITSVENISQMDVTVFAEVVVEALGKLGLKAQASGRNDIVIDGKKVSGTAQRLLGDRILFHGTLLFDSNLQDLAAALNADPDKFKSKSARSVSSRVGNIREMLAHDMSVQEFWKHIESSFGKRGMIVDSPTQLEIAEINRIRREKYDTWDWNYGHSPKYSITYKRRWSGGTLEVNMTIDKGVIQDIMFMGDYLSLSSQEDVVAAFTGAHYNRDALSKVIGLFDTKKYFGSISDDELLDTILNQNIREV